VPFIPAGPVFVPVRLAGSLLLLGLEHLLICAASEPRLCVAMGLLSRAGGRDGDASVRRFRARFSEQAVGSLEHRLDEAVGCNSVDTRRQDDRFPQSALEYVVSHVGQSSQPRRSFKVL
jgi:hypothetical protein